MDHPGVTFKLNVAISNFPGLLRVETGSPKDHPEAGQEIQWSFGLDSTSQECEMSSPVLRSQRKACSHREWAEVQHLIPPVGCSDCVKISCPSLRLTPYELASNVTKAVFPIQPLQWRRIQLAFFPYYSHRCIASKF